jgi:hypothetical protein
VLVHHQSRTTARSQGLLSHTSCRVVSALGGRQQLAPTLFERDAAAEDSPWCAHSPDDRTTNGFSPWLRSSQRDHNHAGVFVSHHHVSVPNVQYRASKSDISSPSHCHCAILKFNPSRLIDNRRSPLLYTLCLLQRGADGGRQGVESVRGAAWGISCGRKTRIP